MMLVRRDVAWAAAAGAAAFAVYVRTLAPGLVATIDTPMFQFIGRVLGVAHPPGYPLYVLLTHPFSFLPIGSLPYRINLFSALLGALAVSLTFLIARRLGCRTTVSLAAALGLAFGQVFWSQAVIAEVYTLHAAIVAGMLLSLLAWGQTRRPAFFFVAVAIFAAGLGNHTTIVGFAPAMAVYALLIDRRFVTRARTLGLSAAILAAGLLQYGFILLRSRQPGAYVEAPATTLRELVDVILAKRFQDRVFAFEWRELALERVPIVFQGVLSPELTWPGLVFAAAGLVWLLRWRPPDGLLLLIGGAAVVGFALVYSVIDTQVFLIPAILVLWLAAAVGAEQAVGTVARRRVAVVVAVLAVLAIPGWLLTRNVAVNDRSRDTAAAVQFDALFDMLPSRTLLVREDFLVDRMVMFKLLGDRFAEGRQIDLVAPVADLLRDAQSAGIDTFAFLKSARQLRHQGVNVAFSPVRLQNGRLPEFLSRLPDGSIVAVAVPGAHSGRFAAGGGAAYTAIGLADEQASSTARSNIAVLGVRGARQGARALVSASDAYLGAAGGRKIGDTGAVSPGAIEVQARTTEAVIRHESRELAATSDGVAIAVWRPDGTFAHALILQSEDDFRVPIPSDPLSVYPLRGTWSRHEVRSDRWNDLTEAVSTGSVMARVPAGAAVVLYVSDRAPLAPRAFDQSSVAQVEVVPFGSGAGAALRAKLEGDGVLPSAFRPGQHVYRIEIKPTEAVSVLLALGGVPVQAIGRVLDGEDAVNGAAVFRIDTAGLLRTPDRSSEVLSMFRDAQSQLIGAGWSAVESDAVGPYRWMTATEARLVLPVAGSAPARIRLQARLDWDSRRQPAGEAGPTTIRLRVNEVELPAEPLGPGWNVYEWPLAPGALRSGVNEASVIVDALPARGATAPGGVAVADLRIVHDR